MIVKELATTPYVGAQTHRRNVRRDGGWRSAAIAAGVTATAGVWGVALWAWLAANGPAAPSIAGPHMPSVTGDVAKGAGSGEIEAPAATKTSDATTPAAASQTSSPNSLATDRPDQAGLPPQLPLISEPSAEGSVQTAPARSSPPAVGAVIVRGRKGLAAPEPMIEGGSLAGGEVQAPEELQGAPDGVTAVFRGHQAETALQATPAIGAVIRGNQSPSTPQGVLTRGPEVLKGARAAAKAETTAAAGRNAQRPSEP
jgi:hypothetical protein